MIATQFMKDEYPDSKSDLFAAFIQRCTNLAGPRGTVAMITMQSWMFLSSYEKLRASLLTKQRITSMLHLGARAFDSIGGEVVSATAFVLANIPPDARGSARKRVGTFIRLVDGTSEAEKAAALSIALELRTKDAGFHLASDADFTAIPGSPIVYWLSEKMRGAFMRRPNAMPVLPFREGMSTSDNDRFVRIWHEISINSVSFESSSKDGATRTSAKWFPFDQGGAFRKWWGNQETVVNWAHDGKEIRGEIPKPRINNPDYFFKAHLTISKITSGPPSFRIFPRGFALASVSKCAFFDSTQSMYEACGLLNSDVVRGLLAATSPTLSFLASDLENLPLRAAPSAEQHVNSDRVQRLVETSRRDWDCFETSWDFAGNPLVEITKSARQLA